jgi:phosphoribosylamine--glycine ligase
MNLLVIGSGGREHALIMKLLQSPICGKIYCAPGNGGISKVAECVNIAADDIESLRDFAGRNRVGLTIVGPEVPLVKGIVDYFEEEGLKCFGPSEAAAAFEGSKALTKEFLYKNDIPSARYAKASSYENAKAIIDSYSYPLVIKADGLAAGKGVFICSNQVEAIKVLEEVMLQKKLGDAGKIVVIEEYLDGYETSCLCFCDGNIIVPMESSKDYKRIGDGDVGLNTGGMGAYSPNPLIDAKMTDKIEKTILHPIMKGFKEQGIVYKGVLYVGLMIVGSTPKVLEFNVRFGDPETQVLLPRLKSDLVKIMLNCTDGLLEKKDVVWSSDPTVCVVVASGGYPGDYETGKLINGLDDVGSDVYVYHAGTTLSEDGSLLTSGGRVLNVCARAEQLSIASSLVYDAIKKISFDGMVYRSDIAKF